VIGLIQRVTEAQVVVERAVVGSIGRGILLLLAVQRGDDETSADRLLERVLGYRIFPDTERRMNLSLLDVRGELLVVSQFTLAADTGKGMRAGFSKAAAPAEGERLYEYFLARARASGLTIGAGRYGAHMQVSLTNDGPVTFWLEVSPNSEPAT
jgi:D-tyrosyl-tRNA(Tyr) deacylase